MPRVAGGRHAHAGERIELVRVEAGGDEHELRLEPLERRHDERAVCRLESSASVAPAASGMFSVKPRPAPAPVSSAAPVPG